VPDDLAERIAELAVDDDDIDLHWTVQITAINIVATAATRDLYADESAAWEGARSLWRAILELRFELTDEGVSELGVVRRPAQDKTWRGKVRMVLQRRPS
jgi:hypothetical protein